MSEYRKYTVYYRKIELCETVVEAQSEGDAMNHVEFDLKENQTQDNHEFEVQEAALNET